MSAAVLEIDDLHVETAGSGAAAMVVDGVSLEVQPGECLGLVGESGAGKSLTLRAAIGLLPPGVRAVGGELRLRGVPYRASLARGREIGMIFQEPAAALNPLMRVGDLIKEGLRTRGLKGRGAGAELIGLMVEAGISDPERSARAWPHELSGGQRQRVAIAMALAAEPSVLLCDEPTTALDVTVQQRILELLDRLRMQRDLAIVFVTHDIAVIDRISHRLAVMYAGRVVESGPADELLNAPQHPYTARLLACLPRVDRKRQLLDIPGAPPDPSAYPAGCRFHPRCTHARPDCANAPYVLADTQTGRQSACIHWAGLQEQLEREST
ncbi:MAG TPA: ABC transporter ATP-binding protein [Solirubrobacteraceae bacterium]